MGAMHPGAIFGLENIDGLQYSTIDQGDVNTNQIHVDHQTPTS
jgi:hypothetical protein